jgi:hypothetical protein
VVKVIVAKECTKCGEMKPIEDFRRNVATGARRTSRCRVCLDAGEKLRRGYYDNWDDAYAATLAGPNFKAGCSVEGCDRPHRSRGWCVTHWTRWYLAGDVQAERPIGSRVAGPGPNPGGLCMCGCGARAPISAKTTRSTGDIVGTPRRYILGHSNRGGRETDEEVLARFWGKVDVRGEKDCWEWTGPRLQSGGYGYIRIRGVTWRAHRYSYQLVNGDLRDDMFIMHACDNPPCVNPNHLSQGTPLDNNRDMWAKGRARPAKRRTKTEAQA